MPGSIIPDLLSGPRVRVTPSASTAEVDFFARGYAIGDGGSTTSAQLQDYIERQAVDAGAALFGSSGFRGWPLVDKESDPRGTEWVVTLTYAVGLGTVSSESESTFDTGSDSQHAVVSKQTVRTYGDDPPNFNRNVGWNGESAEGADLIVPNPRFAETRVVAAGNVTDSFRRKLYSLTGTVNEETFMSHQPGEVLFLGAGGRKRGDGLFELNYNFAWSPNRYNGGTGVHAPIVLTLAGIGEVEIEKAGWEYLWVYYTEQKITSGGTAWPNRVPVSAYVEKFYDSGDFSQLNL